MVKHLILIAQSFPFDMGDEHLEDEFTVTQQPFDHITVVTTGKVTRQTRQLPAHAQTLKARMPLPFLKKLSLLPFVSWILFFREWMQACRKHRIRHYIPLAWMIGGSLIRAEHLVRLLSPIIRNSDPGVQLYFYSYWFDLSALALAFLKKRFPHIVAVSRAHAGDLYYERHPMNFIPFHPFKFRQLDKVYFISQYGARYAAKYLAPELLERTTVLRMGCFALPCRKPISFNGLRIVSIGSNVHVKRFELIAGAVAQTRDLRIHWVHLGESLKNHPQVQQQISELLSARSDVTFEFRPKMPRQEYLRNLVEGNFDLMVHLSSTEGIPVSMMECLAAGIPIVGMNVGGVNELVRDQYNGYLVPPDASSPAIAAILQKFFTLPERGKEAMQSQAWLTWQQDFEAGKNYGAFVTDLVSVGVQGQSNAGMQWNQALPAAGNGS